MSSYVFHRTRKDVFSMPPGTWVPARMDGKQSAYVCCPTCGNAAGIRSHSIDGAGLVTPSLVCSATVNIGADAACAEAGFHEWVELEGWAEVDWSHHGVDG